MNTTEPIATTFTVTTMTHGKKPVNVFVVRCSGDYTRAVSDALINDLGITKWDELDGVLIVIANANRYSVRGTFIVNDAFSEQNLRFEIPRAAKAYLRRRNKNAFAA